MESRAKFLGHAIHPILIAFPIGLLGTSVVFDLLRLISGNKKFGIAAFWNLIAGCVSGWGAMIPGAIDWWFLPKGTRAKRVATTHALVNGVALDLFFASWLLRRRHPEHPGPLALLCSLLGGGLLLVGGWLGGELIERLGVAVSPGAYLDAPSSLTHPHFEPPEPKQIRRKRGWLLSR